MTWYLPIYKEEDIKFDIDITDHTSLFYKSTTGENCKKKKKS